MNVICLLFRVVVVANNSTEAIIQMPEKPTRPLTPYFKFLKDTRPKITGSSESFQHSQDVVKKVAYMWQNLDGVEKARYEQDYADEKVCITSKIYSPVHCKFYETRFHCLVEIQISCFIKMHLMLCL